MKPDYRRLIKLLLTAWAIFASVIVVVNYVMYGMDWPPQIYKDFIGYKVGHPEDASSLSEKIMNDLGIRPYRHIFKYDNGGGEGFRYTELEGLPLKSRRDKPLIRMSPDAPKGFRLVHGLFDFSDNLHGAILLGADGKVEHIWELNNEKLGDIRNESDNLLFPHGIAAFRDGSIVAAFDNGNILTKYDYCGKVLWRVEGPYNHFVSVDVDGNLWVGGRDEIVKVNAGTGAVMDRLTADQMMAANPDIDILGVRQKDFADHWEWADDPFHFNDAEPLTEEFAKHYPRFSPGDLLVSARSLNLIFVMEPSSRKIKWWAYGGWRRQHDPDFNDRGTITVFDNNMHYGKSSIIEIDPASMERKVLVNGEAHDFYTRFRGKHQLLPGGGILITSSSQGRVFELDSKGRVDFEFINKYGSGGQVLALSEAVFLPPDYFSGLPACK